MAKFSNVSVIILTKNEQQDLPGCLQSLSWSDDIHVFDSYSTDETVNIARAFGAKVVQREFDNWSSHQNWGLRNIDFKYPWVYYSDADERVTPELANAIAEAAQSNASYVAYRVRRKDYLEGKWLKFSTPSPFNIRLFRPEKIRYERLTNPVTLVDGEIGDIAAHFNHYPFSKGMSHWISKHNSYSSAEAAQINQKHSALGLHRLVPLLLSKNINERRFAQKEIYYTMPFRPFVMFCSIYLFRLGFLDGFAGFKFSVLRSIYEYMIILKQRNVR